MDNYGAIGALVVLILFFLLGREVICWYFKINKRVYLLEEILDELKQKNNSAK
ncbi:hypothetical protein ICV89_07520 [Polynucleobacter sp. Adler-ghost]|nr:hypothetical protein ICV89_07520 [Polynucleobacter sp. Adler-ghost]